MPLPALLALAPSVIGAIGSIFGKKGGGGGGGGQSLLQTALPSLIQTGAGLLGGFMKGKQTEKEQKKAYETWQKSRGTQFADLEKLTSKRYRTAKDLPAIDPMLKKLLVGRLSQYVSPEQTSKWGIDFPSLLAGFSGGGGGGTPYGGGGGGIGVPSPYRGKRIMPDSDGGEGGGGGRIPFNIPQIPHRGKRGTPELAEDILNKYQMQ